MDFYINESLKTKELDNTLFSIDDTNKLKIIDCLVNDMINNQLSLFSICIFDNSFEYEKFDIKKHLLTIDKELYLILTKFIDKLTLKSLKKFLVFDLLFSIKGGSFYYIRLFFEKKYINNSHPRYFYSNEQKKLFIKDILISLYYEKKPKCDFTISENINIYRLGEDVKLILSNFCQINESNDIDDECINYIRLILGTKLNINICNLKKDMIYRKLILINRLKNLSINDVKINIFSLMSIKLGNIKNIINNIFSFSHKYLNFQEFKYIRGINCPKNAFEKDMIIYKSNLLSQFEFAFDQIDMFYITIIKNTYDLLIKVNYIIKYESFSSKNYLFEYDELLGRLLVFEKK